MLTQDKLQWWKSQNRVLWTDEEVAKRIPQWLRDHSKENYHWLRVLQLPIHTLFAGTIGEKDAFVSQTRANAAVRDMLGGRPLARLWEGFFPLLPPGGQLKNFFVALATVLQAPVANYQIALVGSQFFRPSGVWHETFCRALLLLGYSGEIHAWDPNQEKVEWDYDYLGRKLLFRGHPSVYSGSGKEYSIIVDDIYDAAGPGKSKWTVPYWSQKKQTDVTTTFFHNEEGRTFFPGFALIPSPGSCQCPRCSFERMVPLQVGVMQALSSQVETHPCVVSLDLAQIAKVRVSLYSGVKVQVSVGPDVRAALAISLGENLKVAAPDRLTQVLTGPKIPAHSDIDYNREKGFSGAPHKDIPVSQDFFKDKSVTFFGVSPAIINLHQSVRTDLYHGVYDICFAAEGTLLPALLMVREVYYPGLLLYPGFIRTGRYYRGYYSYIREAQTYIRPIIPIIENKDLFSIELRGELLYRGPSPQAFLSSIGVDMDKKHLLKNSTTITLDRHAHRGGLEYCRVHQYFYPLHKHHCAEEICFYCPRPIGVCLHMSRFQCEECRDFFHPKHTRPPRCLGCKRREANTFDPG